MRDRDRAHLAARPHRLERRVVDERDHVPEDVALPRLEQQHPLADRERGLDADPEHPGVLAHLAAMLAGELGRRRPALAAEPDVLPLVLADRAALRRLVALGELGRAGAADPVHAQGVSRKIVPPPEAAKSSPAVSSPKEVRFGILKSSRRSPLALPSTTAKLQTIPLQ